MTKTTMMNGTGGTSEGLFRHRFSGTPTTSYEFPGDPRDHRGDVYVFEVRAELSKVVSDHVNDGDREIIGWKVIDSKPARLVERSDGHDPAQMTTDDVEDAETVDDLDSDLVDAEVETAGAIESGEDEDPMSIFSDDE